jgi:hypothetical protein
MYNKEIFKKKKKRKTKEIPFLKLKIGKTKEIKRKEN